MRKTQFLYILLLIIIFSCRTSYDKSYVMQCNQSKVKEQKEKLIHQHNIYIDSIYKSVFNSNNIKEISNFIKLFPDHESIENLKKKRKILFQDKEKVLNSGYNINYLTQKNPCYIPLYKNLDYIRDSSFNYKDLYNSILDTNNPYRNRFLVAELNTINLEGKSKGIKEKYLEIEENLEFRILLKFLKNKEINRESLFKEDTNIFADLHGDERKELYHQLRIYKNYISQVEKYRTKEIEKDVSSYNGYKYSGQNLCFCEIREDTIILVAKHIISAKGKTRRVSSQDSITGEKKYIYSDQLPIGKNRKYYAAHYRITIKNWETQRNYTSDDIYRDSLLGGGNARVTFFDGKSQLPNFLLMDPDKLYPKAMKMNGIHEGSLSNISNCMLGTPQSLGCLRMTDYGSKFSRWWIPKYTNLFISYDESLYSNNIVEEEDYLGIRLPFKNKVEGNLFRKWVNKKYPKYAKEIYLEEEGSCSNCFIQLAWEKFYLEYLKTTNGKKLDFIYKNTLNRDSISFNKNLEDVDSSLHNILVKPIIQEEFYTIIGCFKSEKNALAYSKKIIQKKYDCTSFYDVNALCYLVAIGPYQKINQANSELQKIKKDIDQEAWIYTKIIN